MKIKNIFILLISSIFILNCQGTKSPIEITQTSVDYPVKLRFNQKTKQLRYLFLPVEVKIFNNSYLSKQKLESVRYKYSNTTHGGGVSLYKKEKQTLISVGNEIIPITKGKPINFVISSAHYIEQTQWIQDSLQSYLDELLISNENIIEIGSLDEFKSKYPKVLKELTKNDTIKFNFDNPKGQGWEVIKIPVKF
ncbi:hypothetical protein [Aquimarina longa]|uniref:hypothetical protein n=1 Tax=Aquimarina longa TaxID=1080221 RepID=UPI000782DFDC|nr:hypothetical protein [Aquimarina longa]